MSATRIIWGNVNKDGTKLAGNDFDSIRNSAGHYTVTFVPPFASQPSVVVQSWGSGKTLDQAICYDITNEKCNIKTGESSGSARDYSFSFHAIGPA